MITDIIATVRIKIDAPSAEVWHALTTPSVIKQYFFGTDTQSDWQVGSPITFSGIWEGKRYQDKGVIHRIEPQKLLRYNYWSSMSGTEDRPENYVIITYELTEGDNQTLLTVTQENIANEQTREHSEQNWRMVLKQLKELLENPSWRTTHW